MKSQHLFLLKLSVITVFLGRAYQHFFWDVPYRTFIWNEKFVAPILKSLFGLEWKDYANSLAVDAKIQFAIKLIGLLFVVLAVLVYFLNNRNFKYFKIPIAIGGFWQILLALLFTKESFFQIGQFFEYTLQIVLPFLLLYAFSTNFRLNRFIFVVKLAIGFTFFAHGLYALGFYPVPGNFIDMTISVLHTNESNARLFLLFVGILDILILPLLFVKSISNYVLLYVAFWGFLTAFARIIAHFDSNFVSQIMHQYSFEFVVRASNFIVPLLAFFIWNKLLLEQKQQQ